MIFSGALQLAKTGGNWNNSAKCSVFALTVNNTASNTNSNNGTHLMPNKIECANAPCHLAKHKMKTLC